MRCTWLMLVLLTAICAPTVQAAPVYFLVAEVPGAEVHGDSYVLPLENPLEIAHARELIALGAAAEGRIAVARIAEGADGINRDYRAVGQPAWNWHVTEFVGFADSTIELLDGWPSDVERDVPAWIGNTNGMVGFWSYTVVEELSNVPEPGSLVIAVLAAPAAIGILKRKRRRSGDFR
jgi:hypothetical protein